MGEHWPLFPSSLFHMDTPFLDMPAPVPRRTSLTVELSLWSLQPSASSDAGHLLLMALLNLLWQLHYFVGVFWCGIVVAGALSCVSNINSSEATSNSIVVVGSVVTMTFVIGTVAGGRVRSLFVVGTVGTFSQITGLEINVQSASYMADKATPFLSRNIKAHISSVETTLGKFGSHSTIDWYQIDSFNA